MADFDAAFSYLMEFEDDHANPGKITSDEGGRTRFGIAEKWHEALAGTGFFDTMGYDDALAMAKETYRDNEWHLMQGDVLSSQILANKLLSLGVNLGMPRIIRWAQEAASVQPDGFMGPVSVKAINSQSNKVFLSVTVDAIAQYHEDAQTQPQFLKGWLRRANDPAEVTANA